MSTISKPALINLAGIKIARYIFADEIESMPIPSNGIINETDVVLKTGSAWYDLYFTPGTIKGKVQQKQTDAGKLYSIEFSLGIPRESFENTNKIDLASRRPIVFKITDNNNVTKIYGSNSKPLTIDYDINKDGLPGGANGYDISITGKTNFAPADIVNS
jgi:hypothetical protein